jgi:LysR family transcriptional regulator, hca operon transcriptional activator
MSLVASIGGVTLFPLYTQNMLTRAVVARPLRGEPPTIDLLMGYNKSNTSHCSSDFCLVPTSWLSACRKNNAFSRYVEAR